MKYLFLGVCFFGTIAASVFVKTLDLHGGLTAAIIIPLVLLTVYSLANVQPGSSKAESPSEEGSTISRLAEVSE
jgi:hypothetical protein